MPTCDGCHLPFTPKGLENHLRQTINPRCKTFYEAMQQELADLALEFRQTSLDNLTATHEGMGSLDGEWSDDEIQDEMSNDSRPEAITVQDLSDTEDEVVAETEDTYVDRSDGYIIS